jgi:cytochrome c
MRIFPPLAALCLATPAFADGDAVFQKCKPCHSIIAPDGHVVQKGGKIGPNLYGVIGRPVASAPGFDYSPAMQALKATGAVWNPDSITAFLPDPTAWLQNQTGDPAAHSRMGLKLGRGARDVVAYLASLP